jgi:cytochrome P450
VSAAALSDDLPRLSGLGTLRAMLSMAGQRVDMRSRLDQLYQAHGPVVMQQVGPFRMVNLYGPDANRLVLLDREQIFSAEQPWTQIMGRIFPNGLLLMDGARHKQHRKIMHLPFKRPALRQYADQMNPMIESRLAEWLQGDGALLAYPAFKALTLDLAASIFVGIELGPEASRMNSAFEDLVAASMSRIRLPIPGLEFQRGLEARRFMKQSFSALVDGKRNGESADMFSRLCREETEEGERLADHEIVDHMSFLMMAAHDTTTSALSSLTYELARHPEWQERLREEVFAAGRDGVGLDDMDELPQLGWAMKEVLRLYPPLPVIPRIATASFGFDGYRVPEGSMVVISPIHTHRMSEWWDEPDRFDPERFSPERAEHERHTHSWVAFGGGPHMCIGQRFAELQIKAVMHRMLRSFRWSVADRYEMPVQQAPISKPRDGLPIQLAALERL